MRPTSHQSAGQALKNDGDQIAMMEVLLEFITAGVSAHVTDGQLAMIS